MEYKMRYEDGEPLQCDSCGCDAPTGEFDWTRPSAKKRLLCKFCATTLTGTYTAYPARDEFTALRAEIWKAAACVFNMLKSPNANVTGLAPTKEDK